MRSSLMMLLGLAAAACRRANDAPPLFERLAPSATGVTFENRLPEDSSLNILNFLYYYNGGGVAAGDVNGDGRPDLYFTSNLGSDRLYLNRGAYRFEDVTTRAGVAGPSGWKTGVTMADVNGDGKLDIYVSTVSYRGLAGRNALYVNNGDGSFTDRAHEHGLDHQGYGTQAAFFDYDGDGDLDLFVLSFSTHEEQASDAPKRDVQATSGGESVINPSSTNHPIISCCTSCSVVGSPPCSRAAIASKARSLTRYKAWDASRWVASA